MKTVLITGCSSGIGKELVGAFLRSGWRVIGTMRRAAERQQLFEKESGEFGDVYNVDDARRDHKQRVDPPGR